MPFQQLSVRTRYPEFAEELLLAHGALAVSFRDAQDDPVTEPGPGETPLWPHTEAIALFPQDVATAAAIAALKQLLPDGPDLSTRVETLPDRDWLREVEKDCPPLKFGTRLWVCPRTKAVRERGTATVLLTPGLAFGTGTHPSTALCLDWLARASLRGRTVLDYGCGSGVLAIAAARLGAKAATAVDHDPQAVTATRQNAIENRVSTRIRTCLAEEFRPRHFDVVLANILANPLIELAPRLSACVARRGTLILAGVLQRQSEEVMSAYARTFAFEPVVVRDGWARLEGKTR